MIEWQDEGIILGHRRFGENKLITTLMTKNHGIASGIIRQSKSLQGVLQTGNRVDVQWKARLEEHLGYLSLDLQESLAGRLISNHAKLLAISSAACLTREVFPERHPYASMYETFLGLLEAVKGDDWQEVYVHFEHRVLQEMGFALKLEECCVSGNREDLVYVSPKTGRAVAKEPGAPYHDKLLALPSFLLNPEETAQTFQSLAQGFHLMSYFFQKHMLEHGYEKFMRVRNQLLSALERGMQEEKQEIRIPT